LTPQALDVRQEATGGERGQVARAQFSLGDAELIAQLTQALLADGEQLVEAALAFDGGQVGDRVLVFPTPINERGLGNTQFLSDTDKRLPLDPKLDEPLNRLCVMHSLDSFPILVC
jgi:hypothetical protein